MVRSNGTFTTKTQSQDRFSCSFVWKMICIVKDCRDKKLSCELIICLEWLFVISFLSSYSDNINSEKYVSKIPNVMPPLPPPHHPSNYIQNDCLSRKTWDRGHGPNQGYGCESTYRARWGWVWANWGGNEAVGPVG